MSVVRSLSGEKRTSHGHRVSVAIDPTKTSGIPLGEARDPVAAARLKRMGVTSGFPDLVFFGPHGRSDGWRDIATRRGSLLTMERWG